MLNRGTPDRAMKGLQVTLILSNDGVDYTNFGTLQGAPAVRITAASVRFTNAADARANSTAGASPAIVLEGAGATIINLAGAEIRANSSADLAVTGSLGTDTIINSGLIFGTVALGDGADSFTQLVRGGYLVDLGAGNDTYQLGGDTFNEPSPHIMLQQVSGGTGYDTLVLAGQIGQAVGFQTTGFERLVVGTGVSAITGFSNYQEMELAAGGRYQFVDSVNPNLDLAIVGGSVAVSARSSFREIQGTDAGEMVEVRAGGAITGDVDLAGGDDSFWYSAWQAHPLPTLGGTVNGGSGTDELIIDVQGGRTIDLEQFSGFEKLNVGGNSGLQVDVRLVGADDYKLIVMGHETVLTLAASDLSQATLRMSYPSTVVLEQGTTVQRVGIFDDLGFVDPGSVTQANPDLSSTLVNAGVILGDVRFYAGDDRYDGDAGWVGGTVFGYSGDDRLIGGTGLDRLVGGLGNDTLLGNAGSDVLTGEAGADHLDGGDGDDLLLGGAGNDTIAGGSGIDTAVYAELFRSYQVQLSDASGSVAGNAESTDMLASIEFIRFTDGTFVFNPDGIAAQVTRLYDTVLQRGPDQVGLDSWVDRLEDQGGTLKQIAAGFLNSAEFQAKTGSLSNGDYVDFLYQNALGRPSDVDGKSYWVGQLQSGAQDRADLLIGFSESQEHRGLTADLVGQGFFNTDDDYQAVALLYDTFAGRRPDAGGLIYWAEGIENGTFTLDQVADGFANSPEFLQLTQGMSNSQLVNFLYQNTLDRASDSEGLSYWTARLDAGMDRGDLLLGFSQSYEHFNLLGAQVTSGIDYL